MGEDNHFNAANKLATYSPTSAKTSALGFVAASATRRTMAEPTINPWQPVHYPLNRCPLVERMKVLPMSCRRSPINELNLLA